MNVTSEVGIRRKIHYVAPPAHIWFVQIHPFGDGNGRLTRNITHHILPKALGFDTRYFSISHAIELSLKKNIFFYAIPILASMILFACEEDTVLYLLEERSRLKLKQVFFGKVALEHASIKAFFKINFP